MIKTDLEKDMVEFKGSKISYGRYLFNKCLPDNYPLIDKPVDKKELNIIINDIALRYPNTVTIETLDKIKELGFKISTEAGYTLSLDDLYDPYLKKRAYALDSNDINKTIDIINNDEDINNAIMKKDYFTYVKSGSRGSIEQLKQLVFCRGFIADANNNIRPNLIKNNLVCGLNDSEAFESCYGARKGLLDTAVSTGQAGYITRQLIYSTIEIELDPNSEDCGTLDGLHLLVSYKDDNGNIITKDTESLAKSILWRYNIEEDGSTTLITTKNYMNYIGKRVKLRSPIYCKNKKICKKCYGNLFKMHKSPQIGILATHAIGEKSVQLILRSFHFSFYKDTQILDINNNKYTIEDVYNKVKNGEDFYTFSCSSDGEIMVSKVIDAHADHITNKMIVVTLDNDEEVKVTHGHEMMMRDGSYKNAEDLKIGDSLMPTDNGNVIVKNIEFVTLENEERFYDLTVDNPNHNFALGAGIFVHNSGGVSSTTESGGNNDIISGMEMVNKIFHVSGSLKTKPKSPTILVKKLQNIFSSYGNIHLVHFEVIISSMMWYNNKKWRLLKNRKELDYNYESVLKVPSLSSWLVGAAFSRIKNKLLEGLIQDRKEDTSSSLSDIFRF